MGMMVLRVEIQGIGWMSFLIKRLQSSTEQHRYGLVINCQLEFLNWACFWIFVNMNSFIQYIQFLLLSLLILNSMKFLRMPNRAQSLKQPSLKSQNNNKQNIDPVQTLKPTSKPTQPLHAMQVEEPKNYQRQEEVYEDEILQFLISSVRQPPQNFNYFEGQPDITEHMRLVLFNWLIDVHLKYKLHPQTFFITINIIDTYLSVNVVYRNELQLVGITALWIAAKYEETYQVPKISNLVYICDSTYTDKQILEMESKILLKMNFDFLKITSFSYYEAIKRHTFMKDKDEFLGRYLMEGILFDMSTRKYSELTIASAVIFFIQKLRGYELKKGQKVSEITGVSEKELRACAREICGMWQKINDVSQMNSLRQKYTRTEFMEVAKIRLSEKNEKAMK